MSDHDHLLWIYNRMIAVHSEHKNRDYMLRFKRIIDDALELKPQVNVADLALFKCCKVFRIDGTYECKRCGLWWDHNDQKPECMPASLSNQGG